MIEKILAFIEMMRKSGLKVSLVETLDCFQALQYIEWDKDSFYSALRTTLIKDCEYIAVFDKLFLLFFTEDFFIHHDEKARIDSLSCIQKKITDNPISTEQSCTQGMGGMSGQGHGRASSQNFVDTILHGSESELQQLISQGIVSFGEFQEKDLACRNEAIRKIKVNLNWKMGEYELEKLMTRCSETEKLRVKEKLLELEALLQLKLDQEFIRLFKAKGLEEILKRKDLNKLDFFRLSSNQVQEIRRKITKLAHKLATRVSRREVKSKKGKIKLAGTLRKSMSTGGIPIYPMFKRKKPTRPQFVVLCDLSGSVRLFSEFMLQLVYSIQNRFVKVKSFAFVDTVQEITPYFLKEDITTGIKGIYYDGKFSKTGFSDYGQSFLYFNTNFPGLVTKKTTVLILGDARNNYQPSCVEELKIIKENAHKVIWLNPAPKASWGQEDSIIQFYGQYCSQVYECRNLIQLENAVKKIF